ncbi:MAG: 4Fe-4S binding protein, partial [Deltaproteobacteria bacterium]|nr:4Fe-4S binding protein [Deltaproteobacteria bacterium]
MLKTIRIVLAAFFFTGITWLFLDVTETAQHLLGWMARIQFLPAILALSIGIVALLVLLTLIFGRIYCSTICPLGVFQDICAWLGTRRKKNRYHFSKARNPLRYGALAAFIALSILGVHSLALLLAPYSGYGRIAQNLFSPVYRAGNNLLALLAERANSYAFSASDIFIRSWPAFVITFIFFTVIVFLAIRHGRLWCNTLCPVGTVLGFLARFSWFKPVLDNSACVSCHACEQRCKASYIDIETHSVDASRCVACMNCIGNCPQGAIHYGHSCQKDENKQMNKDVAAPLSAFAATRRNLLLALPAVLSSTIPANAAQNTEGNRTDGGLAELKPRKAPKRIWPLRPPGSQSQKNFRTRCTACQLCVAACPNGVLRPSSAPLGFMQPEMGFERGFCRPECRRCSEV